MPQARSSSFLSDSFHGSRVIPKASPVPHFDCSMIELPSTEAAAMSEALKIALTALVGVVVFVIGQIAVKFLIEPLHDQKS